jgi:hypothetical protein
VLAIATTSDGANEITDRLPYLARGQVPSMSQRGSDQLTQAAFPDRDDMPALAGERPFRSRMDLHAGRQVIDPHGQPGARPRSIPIRSG